jgi:hypothetical protein
MSLELLLSQVAAGTLSVSDAAKLMPPAQCSGAGANVKLKVSEKGCITFRNAPGVSVKFGATHYVSFVEWILDNQETVRKFIADNAKLLARRVDGEKSAA